MNAGSRPASESGKDTANDTVKNAIGECPFNTGVFPIGTMKYTKEKLESVVKDSLSMRQVLFSLGLKDTGGNRSWIKSRIDLFRLDTSHFVGQGWRKGKSGGGITLSLDEFIEKVLNNRGGGWKSHEVKLKLYKLGLKKEQCEKCGQLPVWYDNKLSLQLNHKDGDHFNYVLTNLEILCPNCHSQTSNFAGKNAGVAQHRQRQ